MVLTYIISKGVITNKTIEEIVCPALILAANSTDDLHIQNNIVTVNNYNSFSDYIFIVSYTILFYDFLNL